LTREVAVDVDGYVIKDEFFGRPYLDVDEARTEPVAHRYVHGGFKDTDTRFSCYFPPAEHYRHRLLQPIEGGMGGQESFHGSAIADIVGMGIQTVFSAGGYLVETNQGHVGPTPCARAGEDPTIYGYRASAEAARLSKYLAAQVYGRPPDHAYAFGGGGGAHRTALGLANTDVWDGALPFDGAGEIGEPGNARRTVATAWGQFSSWLDVVRVLGPDIAQVVDTTDPGGRGDIMAGLSTSGREALAAMYRLGFPRGAEPMIPWAAGPMSMWAWSADTLTEQDPGYVDAFWSEPGYAGHDTPEQFAADRIEAEVVVSRILTGADVVADPRFAGSPGAMRAAFYGPDAVLAVEVETPPGGYVLGASMEIVDGAGAGRRLYCNSRIDDVLFGDAMGEAGIVRFLDVLPGDRIRLDNRAFLAFCHFHRHFSAPDEPGFASFFVDGTPIFPQRPPILNSPFLGPPRPAAFGGKMLWVQHTHDSNVWPAPMATFDAAVRANLGDAAGDQWCVRWTEHAENLPPMLVGGVGAPAAARLVDWRGSIEQGLQDLIAWVEDGVRPAATNYQLDGGRLTLPATAEERGGIQPVVRLTAAGSDRAEAGAGATVQLDVHAAVPAGQGGIIALEWDPEGTGEWVPDTGALDGTEGQATRSLGHTYARPGTYFPGVRITSHRHGEVTATVGRITNLGRARVVVE
jgi:hypothetical protein